MLLGIVSTCALARVLVCCAQKLVHISFLCSAALRVHPSAKCVLCAGGGSSTAGEAGQARQCASGVLLRRFRQEDVLDCGASASRATVPAQSLLPRLFFFLLRIRYLFLLALSLEFALTWLLQLALICAASPAPFPVNNTKRPDRKSSIPCPPPPLPL